MQRLHGVRARLTLTLVALVATTAILLGVGSYLFVARTLHQQLLDVAEAQARFDLTVTVPAAGLPAQPTPDDVADSLLLQTFQQRGIEAVIDLGEQGAAISDSAFGEAQDVVNALPPDLAATVAAGQLAFAWTTVGGQPSLVVGGPGGPGGASGAGVYFIHDATTLQATLDQLRLALIVGTVALILVALIVARSVARGVLAPVEAASRAAERIEGGDLSARVPVTSDDEFGAWAERFNRMAVPPWPRRSGGSRRPRRRTAGSWRTSRTNCGRRWRPWSPRPRSCATTSARCRTRAGGPGSCSSGTSPGCEHSSTT